VSKTFHTDEDFPSEQLNQFFTIFGQFVTHDISLSPTYSIANCCLAANNTQKCAPITVHRDSFYPNGKCLSFIRSITFCEALGCDTDPFNSITAYIDGSNIYGSDSANAVKLRTLRLGKLAVSNHSLLPVFNGAFVAGDSRAFENPALLSMHTLFTREHNRVAQIIHTKFPNWSDEKVYQHTRRLVVAEYGNIVFGEYLPLVIGTSSVFPADKVATQYKPGVDASVLSEFSTAAFRFGHSQITGKLERLDPYTGAFVGSSLLRFNFNNETVYKQNPDRGMTSIIKGLASQSSQKFDQFVTKEVTQFLFSLQTDNFQFGEDLVTRNIQRGRDHSIQPWLSYRNWCGCSTPDDWNVRPAEIDAIKWATLKTLYERVSDIDLFTGGLAETPVPGGTVGRTFACIITNQFTRFIQGDRYFFTHGSGVGAKFAPNQIAALRNVKMADIVCKTTSIAQMQRNAFLLPTAVGGTNAPVACTSAYNLDINIFFGE